MTRMLPTECARCGGVIDWGDFGPDDDPTCTCPPPPPSLHSAMAMLAAAAKGLGYVVESVAFRVARPDDESETG